MFADVFDCHARLQWARDEFEGSFSNIPETLNQFLKYPNYVEKLLEQPTSPVCPTRNSPQLPLTSLWLCSIV